MKLGMIHTRICLLLWTIGLSVLAACQPDMDEDLEQGAPVNVVVTTRTATTNPDAQVKRLRLIATGWNATNTGSVSYNQLVEAPGNTTGFNVKARKGYNNFYLVANETPAMTAALAAVRTADELERLKVNFQPLPAGESPVMFGTMKNVEVIAVVDAETQAKVSYTDENGTPHANADKLPMTLVRTSARFSLTFIKNSDAFTVKNINFKVLRIPAYAPLGATKETYPGTEWSKETLPQSSTAALTDNNTAQWDTSTDTYTFGNSHRVDFADFYLPQHLLTDAHRGNVDFCTVLIVNGTCVMPGGREQDANWRIDLMTNDFSIKRNTHYKIAATISGMGAMGMSTEVMPMTQHDIPVNWGTPDGLAVVSDRAADYNKNVNIANDVTAYSGILKLVKNVDGNPTYHNVLFKQGSIVGISAEASTTGGNSYTAATDVIYNPALTGHSYNVDNWTDIPTSTSSIASTDNTLAELRAGHGDPCQLIGVTPGQMQQGRYTNGLWHTATTEDLQRLIANGDHTIDGTTTADTHGLLVYHELLLPVTAHRNNSGTLTAADKWGYYLSSTPGQVLSFDATDLNSPKLDNLNANAQSAYTVRCVRNTIPASTLTANTTSVAGYKGGAFTINVRSNVPYWKAEAVAAVTGFTFAPATGNFNGSVSGSVSPHPQTSDRQFTIRISGNGYDGTAHTQDLVVIQRGFTWSLTKVSSELPTTIPQAGGTYEAVVKLGPDDVTVPANTTVTLTMQINGVNQTGVQTQNVVAGTNSATFTYTVPQNTTDVSRMMSFVFKASVSSNATVTSSVMQSK